MYTTDFRIGLSGETLGEEALQMYTVEQIICWYSSRVS